MPGILTYALHYEGEFNKNSLGAVSQAAKLASKVCGQAEVLVLGDGIDDSLATGRGSTPRRGPGPLAGRGARQVRRGEGLQGRGPRGPRPAGGGRHGQGHD